MPRRHTAANSAYDALLLFVNLKGKRQRAILALATIFTSTRGVTIDSGLTSASQYFGTIVFATPPLYASLIFSAYFLIRQKKHGIWITYGQFPLRLLLIVLSFSLFHHNESLLSTSELGFKIFLSIILMFEVVRLVVTAVIHRKYFGRASVSVLTQN